MTILTKQYIDEHCASLNISRFALTEFTIPDGFTEIGIDAFSQCFALESINIPNSVTMIGEEAFDECTSLTNIFIPDSMTTIGKNAFWNCSSLTKIICNNPNLFTDQNIDNRDQIQFISVSDYLKDNYQTLINAINDPRNSSEFNTNHVSSKKLNLIMKLQRADYFPNWETIANTFEDRSIYQIRSILSFYNKTQCFPHENKVTTLLPLQLRNTTMFLNPIENEMLMRTTTFLYRTT